MITRIRNYLSGTSLGPQMIKAVIGSAGLRIAGMGFGLLVGVQLARGLGVEGYGVYGLAMSTIALLTVPTEFGLPQLVTREVAAARVTSNWSLLRGVLRWASRTSLLISLVVALSVLAWLVFSGQGFATTLGLTLVVGLIMVPIVAQGKICCAALRGLEKIVQGQFPETVLRPALFSFLLFIAPLLFVPLNPAFSMGLGALSASLVFFVSYMMLRKEMPVVACPSEAFSDARKWWPSAFPMALTEGMRVLQAHLVILFIGMLGTLSMVGVYRVASSVALLVAVPVTLFNVVSAPVISRLYTEDDRHRLQQLLAWVAMGMTVGTLCLVIPFILAGDILLGTVFGHEFAKGRTALLILCVGVVINSFFGANATLLNMTGFQGRVTRASSLSLILLVIVSPLLILGAGIEGAAVGSSLALGLWNYLMWRDALRLLSLNSCAGAYFNLRR